MKIEKVTTLERISTTTTTEKSKFLIDKRKHKNGQIASGPRHLRKTLELCNKFVVYYFCFGSRVPTPPLSISIGILLSILYALSLSFSQIKRLNNVKKEEEIKTNTFGLSN